MSVQSAASYTPAQESVRVGWRDFLQMTKPVIGLLVVVTAVPSLLLAAPHLPSAAVVISCLCGTYLASMSAGVFNHLIDHDADSKMLRTQARPLPRGKVQPVQAFIWATLLGVISFAWLYKETTPLAAWVAVAANAFYVLVYTVVLKPRTPQNIVIGGAAGAVGPLIGWAAVTGTMSWQAWVLFGIIFLWTPPHFWALALKYKDDYASANIPMYPVVYGDARTRRSMFFYTLALIPTVVVLFTHGGAGWVYLVPSLMATLYFAWLSWKLYRAQTNELAMRVFHFSCVYLFAIFGALAADRLVQIW